MHARLGYVPDDPARHDLLTAASCTTNCLAPVVKVVHEGLGIRHGVITTVHDVTNTQSVLDAPHKDLRRARASIRFTALRERAARAVRRLDGRLRRRLVGEGPALLLPVRARRLRRLRGARPRQGARARPARIAVDHGTVSSMIVEPASAPTPTAICSCT